MGDKYRSPNKKSKQASAIGNKTRTLSVERNNKRNNSPNDSSQLKIVPIKPNITDREEILKAEIIDCLEQLSSIQDVDSNIVILERLKSLITISTGFASIPETLKILFPKYDTFKSIYAQKTDCKVKRQVANIISFIATAHPPDSKGDVLQYYLLGSQDPVHVWGISYVRDLVTDIVSRWKDRSAQEEMPPILFKLITDCSLFYMKQNSELEACDLLIETEQLADKLKSLIIVEDLCSKVCHYVTACAPYLLESDNKSNLYSVLNLWIKYEHFVQALFVAIGLHDVKFIQKILKLCKDVAIQKQMALILARHNLTISCESINAEVSDLMSNSEMNRHFIMVARQLDVMEPKSPNDIIKNRNNKKLNVDIQSSIIGSSFLNCFVNAAFGTDKLILVDKGLNWICRHKDASKISATGCLGILCLWDVDGGLNKIDKYLYSTDVYIKAGALMACGIVNSTIRSEFDPAFLLLNDYVANTDENLQMGAIVGLALAYVGTNHLDTINSILKTVQNDKTNPSIVGIGAISCGLISTASANDNLLASLIEILAKNSTELGNKTTRNIIHGIGLCVMGRSDALPTISNAIQTKIQSDYVKKYLKIFVDICVNVGSSNILKIQELIKVITEIETRKTKKLESKKSDGGKSAQVNKPNSDQEIENDNWIQMISVVGIGLISAGDDLNCQMIVRMFGHFLQHGDCHLKNSVIITIALIFISNPKMEIIDLLSKYSHCHDINIAINAILALGFISAGTNNARVSILLSDLTIFYNRKPSCQFAIKISQGLVHLGKGILTLNPQMDGRLIRHSSISGLLIVLLHLFEPDNLIKDHHFFFFLSSAIRPKIMITMDDKMNSISVPVRVGQSVDTIGQAGNPRSITGFQTLNTPILLGQNEKAELATDEYVALNSILEGCVILKRKESETQSKI